MPSNMSRLIGEIKRIDVINVDTSASKTKMETVITDKVTMLFFFFTSKMNIIGTPGLLFSQICVK